MSNNNNQNDAQQGQDQTPPKRSRKNASQNGAQNDDKQLSPSVTPSFRLSSISPSATRRSRRSVIKLPPLPPNTLGFTGLTSDAKDVLLSTVNALGKFELVSDLEACSHLIIDDQNACRTLKILFAIARGAWILDIGYIYRSLEAHRWINCEDYECKKFPGARLARLARQHNDRPLLSHLKIYIGSKIEPGQLILQQLAFLAGAKLCKNYKHADVAIADPNEPLTNDDPDSDNDDMIIESIGDNKSEKSFAPIVKATWLFDSIAGHSALSLSGYVTVQATQAQFSQDF